MDVQNEPAAALTRMAPIKRKEAIGKGRVVAQARLLAAGESIMQRAGPLTRQTMEDKVPQ